ncbi:MAG TPA: hypothetical protein PKM16_09965 [Bacteroidia bacterium]|nr:hypothetical protein [Bacteroidia bacterium]HNS11690.1 hypothetical protein [Bacteroidia bacterium]
MKNSILFLSISLILFSTSCKKEDDPTTSTTSPQSTAPEFKCIFNGSVKYFDAPGVSETVGHTIYAGSNTSNDVVIFNLLAAASITSYYIHPWVGIGNPYGAYDFVDIDSGMVTITDTTNRKISGTFYFRSGLNVASDGTFKNLALP